MPGGPALGALEAVGPTSVADGLDALDLGAIQGHELPEGEALLELDVIPRHVAFPTKIIDSGGGHFLSHPKKFEAAPTLFRVPMHGIQAEGRR